MVKSGFWSFFSRISIRGLSFLKIIILAQLLAPSDFGLLAIALLTLSIFEVFSKAGFKESIIQRSGNVKPYLNSVWTLLILRGFLLYGLIFFLSPYIAFFFVESRAEILIKIFSIVLIFRGLNNIGIVFFQKELEFKKRFILDLSNYLPDFIISIILVSFFRSVWVLVFGIITGELSLLIFSYLIHPYKPKLELKKDKIIEKDLNHLNSHLEKNIKEQREGAAHKFNKNIEKIIEELKLPKFEKIYLDIEDNNKLKIIRKGNPNPQAINSLSAGERVIVSSLLQISAKETYNPEIPFIVGDDIILKMDNERREIFYNYLKNIAKENDWFVILTRVTDEDLIKEEI